MSKNGGAISRFFTKLWGVGKILFKVKKGDVLFLQYPMKKFYKISCTFAHWKGAKVMTIIHDLGAFRRKKLTPGKENKRLDKTDFLIVHNERMKEHVLRHGFKGGIHCLGIFDYLSAADLKTYVSPHPQWQVLYAGGLSMRRNAFLYSLHEVMVGWCMELYGNGLDTEKAKDWQHIHYHGFVDSEELIANAEADFGLVWDGDSVDECSGNWGEYLKINNPHKTSCYLRAHIPVIVWKQAAMAAFVEKNGVGIAVDSLKDIGEALRQVSAEEYQRLKANASRIGDLIGHGHYVMEGIHAGMAFLEQKK